MEKCSNIKYHKYLSSGSRVVPCGQTDGRTDISKRIAVFRNFANALKKSPLTSYNKKVAVWQNFYLYTKSEQILMGSYSTSTGKWLLTVGKISLSSTSGWSSPRGQRMTAQKTGILSNIVLTPWSLARNLCFCSTYLWEKLWIRLYTVNQ